MGRWLSGDPIGQKAGPNVYAYCGNSPLNGIDRLGLYDPDSWWERFLYSDQSGWHQFLYGQEETQAITGAVVAAVIVGSGAAVAEGLAGAGEAAATGEEATAAGEVAEASEATETSEIANTYPEIPENPAESPGEGWEWRGNGEPGSDEGSWYNPETDESLHPDLNHEPPMPPHWDYTDPEDNLIRLDPETGQPLPDEWQW